MPCRVLLVNPPATRKAYLDTNVNVGTPRLPSLSLAAVGGALRSAGHEPRLLDLDLADVSGEPAAPALEAALADFRPDFIGITSITPTWHAAMEIAAAARRIMPAAKIALGGVHATLFPEETLAGGSVDFAVLGEADFTLNDLIDARSPADVPGLAVSSGGAAARTGPRALIGNLDDLPPPAWDLFDRNRYRMSRLTERRRPGGFLETSRGCPFNCIYCNKSTFGRKFRAKSPPRVLEEIDTMIRVHGFRELHIVDDGFSTDPDRAKEICRLVINSGLKFPFNLFNGIRADRVDEELIVLLKRAGCYQVAFGVESGSDRILESVSKGLARDKVRRAVALCGKHGVETFGFFMIGLPEDTRETVLETIRFAVELDMTISKFDIAVPLPGTAMFETLDSRGLVKSKDWRRYIFHRTDEPLFDHPNLSWNEIADLYRLAYRRVYLRPAFIAKRFVHGLKTGGLLHDAAYFLNARWR